jgi:DNA-binding LacI/PurR family transcriptional regulator
MWWEAGADTIRVGRRQLPLAAAFAGPEAPTAVFVWNDHGAIALIDACEATGIRVPADLSVVGFDDIAIAGLHRISLSTIAQPFDVQAERAVAMLLDRINGRSPERAQHLTVPVTLRARGSSAPPDGVRRGTPP